MRAIPFLLAALASVVSPSGEPVTPHGDPDPPVFRAIRNGDKTLLRSLLRERAVVNVRLADGTTPLMTAALFGDAACVRLLIEHGADVKAVADNGVTALLWGAGDPEKVRLLLAAGADPNARSKLGNAPLDVAASHPTSLASVRALVEAGAKLGGAGLYRAAMADNRDAVRVLLTLDPPKRKKNRALLIAAGRGYLVVAKMLLQAGADPNHSDGGFAGHALNIALLNENPEMARILLEAGADPRTETPIGKVSPIALATYMETDDPASVARLIDCGVEPDETAVAWATKRGHRRMIARLGARPDRQTSGKRKVIPNNEPTGDRAPLVKDSVRRSLRLLQNSSDVFLRNRNDCVSCHHQNLPGVALGWARDRGFSVDEGSIRRMVDAQMREWDSRVDLARQMAQPVAVPPRLLGYGSLGLAALGRPPGATTTAMMTYLANTQAPDGHWDSSLRRPPMGDDPIQGTALAMRALQLFPPLGDAERVAAHVSRARAWLERAKPRTHQQRAMRLLGLGWAGVDQRELQADVARLLEDQRNDGGWAQLPGIISDAWATGQTLVALHVGGGLKPSHPAYRRAVDFLLRTQFEDGSWFVPSRSWPFQPHFDSEYPHGKDQWISAGGAAWATMAMVLAVEPFKDVVLDGGANKPSAEEPVADTSSSAEPEGAVTSVTTADFNEHVKPILERSCVGCHSGEKPKGNFLMTSRKEMLLGGESGNPAVIPGKGDRSPLVRLASGKVEDMEMPPLDKRKRYPALSEQQIGRLRAWIDGGARWPKGVTLKKGGY